MSEVLAFARNDLQRKVRLDIPVEKTGQFTDRQSVAMGHAGSPHERSVGRGQGRALHEAAGRIGTIEDIDRQ